MSTAVEASEHADAMLQGGACYPTSSPTVALKFAVCVFGAKKLVLRVVTRTPDRTKHSIVGTGNSLTGDAATGSVTVRPEQGRGGDGADAGSVLLRNRRQRESDSC